MKPFFEMVIPPLIGFNRSIMFGNGTDAGMTMPHIPCFDHDAHPPMFVDIDLDLHL